MEFVEKYYIGSSHGGILPMCAGTRSGAVGHSFGPASRDHFWMIFIDEGEGEFRSDAARQRLVSQDVIFEFPDRPIEYRADPGSIWTIYWLCLDSEPDKTLLDALGVSPASPVMHSPGLGRMFSELTSHISDGSLSSEYLCVGLIFRIFSSLIGDGGDRARDEIDDAVSFMQVNYDQPITVSDAAISAGMGLSVFSRRFRLRTGKTPSAFLEELRMNKARELIVNTDMMIQDIAYSVGFSDPLYFSRRFAERHGMPPSRLRAERISDSRI